MNQLEKINIDINNELELKELYTKCFNEIKLKHEELELKYLIESDIWFKKIKRYFINKSKNTLENQYLKLCRKLINSFLLGEVIRYNTNTLNDKYENTKYLRLNNTTNKIEMGIVSYWDGFSFKYRLIINSEIYITDKKIFIEVKSIILNYAKNILLEKINKKIEKIEKINCERVKKSELIEFTKNLNI